MTKVAIIGGTGLTSLNGLEIIGREIIQTPFGEPSGPLVRGNLAGHQIYFLPRHGAAHTIPPHRINYRANIWALKEAGIKQVIAVNAVGGIREDMQPGVLIIPDQVIDYTVSRTSTFFEEGLKQVVHIDFTEPYCETLRKNIISAADSSSISVIKEGTYAATQGPRLETAAEVNRLEKDGCHLVGMTGMPEAALAREQELCYASISVVANLAAGRGTEDLTMEMIERNLNEGMEKVRQLLEAVIPKLD
ncbi:MAG: S-methyl-5'-thioinosine phosphorylase [Gammaproteobacteria bacterium]|nr:S-methyl-5'-thioinosine phosphorylase [Gammaproteobacteria bacterium]MCW8987507.1 S-methyl-5'-thioinosine phosphorylase [Gammaproteobacteria bacterium]MCW9031188.1 S-methyl-5'-thioinosine phosphorylase [Gammaproteobacteria bacterium]